MKKRPLATQVERVLYSALFDSIQEKYIKSNWELEGGNISDEERREKIMAFLKKEVSDRQVHFESLSDEELVIYLYNDICEYSILTQYINDDNVEGINVNAWNNIRVKYHSGESVKVPFFFSPAHAITITQRMLQKGSNATIDSGIPMAEASLGSEIRITAVITPIVSEDIAVAMYIRRLRKKVFTTDEYVAKNFATPEVLRTVQVAIRRGVSTLFLGKVNTGKTTLLKHALDSLPDDMQIITIETGSREMNLVKYDTDGNPMNNVVHLLTRENNEDESMNITQEKLVVKLLRLNPDFGSVAEMRDVETHASIEAANSGNIMISTAHAGSLKYGHKRIAHLSRKKYPTDLHAALVDAVNAFPLGVFIHTTEDGIRRIMNVSEAYVDGNDGIHYNCLWRYNVIENKVNENGTITVVGGYERVNPPSDDLMERMRLYGITKDEISAFYGGEAL